MAIALSDALITLRRHEGDLRRLGAEHASVFGSVARGQAGSASDVDILVDLSPDMGLFGYSRLRLYLGQLLDGADVVNGKTLQPLLRDNILRDAVRAF